MQGTRNRLSHCGSLDGNERREPARLARCHWNRTGAIALGVGPRPRAVLPVAQITLCEPEPRPGIPAARIGADMTRISLVSRIQ
jgi:hypothetical protein